MPEYPTSINRQTIISFPLNDNREDITTGIEAGSLYLNKILFEKQLNFGECHSDRFEVTLFDCDDITGETIQVYQLDYTEDENNPVRKNLFYGVVDSCTREDNGVNRRIVAYDLMYTIGNTDITDWWNTFWNNSITHSITQIFVQLMIYMGLSFQSAMDDLDYIPNDPTITNISGVQAITFGTLLSYIGQIFMVNPHFDEEGNLRFIRLNWHYNRSTYSIADTYEDENSHFENYTTAPITRVVVYGETDVIAGEYGTGDNVYVFKNNPLLYNLVNYTYNQIAENYYNFLYDETTQTGREGTCYVPANIKMIVSKPDIQLGDIVTTIHGESVVSSIELSGTMLIEQTIISAGNQKLTPDDFNLNEHQVGSVIEQATTTAKHFVWVPNDGAYVTTDNVAAGQAPTQNYSKLTDTGLYVATDGQEVAHFGIDENDEPVSVLGSTAVGATYTIMNSEGIISGKQIAADEKIDYFNINVPNDDVTYQMTLGKSVETNQGINAVVLGDTNTVTDDSQLNVFVAGSNNTVDNNRLSTTVVGTYVLGNNNNVEHRRATVLGMSNSLLGNAVYNAENTVVGNGNTIENSSTQSYLVSSQNQVIGLNNQLTGDNINNVVVGENNSLTSSIACFVFGESLQSNGATNATIVGRFNNTATAANSGKFIVGNGSNSSSRHTAMVVGDGVTLYPRDNISDGQGGIQQNKSNALIFNNGGADRTLYVRYQNDAGGTNVPIISVVPTGTSNGAVMGIGASGLTVVGGGESTHTIAADPTTIGLDPTTSENAVVCADGAVNIISNANTIANYKIMTFQTNGLLKINACSGTGNQFAYFNSAGQLNRDTVRTFYAKGDSFNLTFNGLGGYVTSSSTQVYVHIPVVLPPSLPNTSTITINMILRHQQGGYPYIYNSTASVGTSSGATAVVNAGTKMTGLSSFAFSNLSNSGFTLSLNFGTSKPLQRSASSTSTTITNNAPIGVYIQMSGTFST